MEVGNFSDPHARLQIMRRRYHDGFRLIVVRFHSPVSPRLPRSLQIEGAVFSGVEKGCSLVSIRVSGAEAYELHSIEQYAASIDVEMGTVEQVSAEPSEIDDITIEASGLGSWHVFVNLPFRIESPCSVELSLRSGSKVRVSGTGCSVSLGLHEGSLSITPGADGT